MCKECKIFGVETKTYGCLLIPLLKDKLPEQMLLEIYRGFDGAVWTLEGFLKGLNKELQAKESVLGCTKGERRKDNKSSYTVDGFHVQCDGNREFTLKCVYCLGRHSSAHCSKVTDVTSRRKILKRFSRCFICLKSGHIASICSSSYL